MPKIIVIDEGHSEGGKPDPGASGNGLVEAIVTGQLGPIIKQQLSGYDAEVLFAPRGTLSERAAFANAAGADLFVSVHINAGNGTGYESFVYISPLEDELRIAQSIHATLAAFYGENGFIDRGLKRQNFAVLRETKMAAILLENLFIDDPEDADFLRKNLPAIGNEIAYAIAVAVELRPRTVNPCDICQKYLAASAEIRRLRQVIKGAGGVLAPEMI